MRLRVVKIIKKMGWVKIMVFVLLVFLFRQPGNEVQLEEKGGEGESGGP
jgi:hypothetical protein